VSQFCRHNRFLSDCPICAKGTVLDSERRPERRSRPAPAGSRTRKGKLPAPAYKGPFVTVGPYEHEDLRYEVRLEQVPGGLRFASWTAGSINRTPVRILLLDMPKLLSDAVECSIFSQEDMEVVGEPGAEAGDGADVPVGRSRGRAGDLRDELRVERLDDHWLRFARWVDRPGSGWQLQEAPVMLPAARYVEALSDAGRHGVLS
jgi:hypothetical protein